MTNVTLTKKNYTDNKLFIPICSFLISAVILVICASISGVIPFGTRTLATKDAFFQYMDFFAWFRDVLTGDRSAGYSNGIAMGENAIGIISTYLMSPFALLTVLFPKEKIEVFYNVIVLLKMIIPSVTASFCLMNRFPSCKKVYLLICSVCYGLMPFMLFQANNSMWMDAVYMLPLVIFGVDKVILNPRKTWFLSLMVGITIIIQWYQGALVCLFSGIFFFAEYFIVSFENDSKVSFKDLLIKLVSYVKGMIVGVMISSFIFIPSVYVMSIGKGSSFDFAFFKNEMLGNITTSVLLNYPGSTSRLGEASLFCGSFIILGGLCFFLNKCIRPKVRIAGGLLLAFMIMSLYWRPLFFIFSLLKNSFNFHYRYSYLTCFVLVYLACYFFSQIDMKQLFRYILGVAGYIVLYVVLNVFNLGSLDTDRLIRVFEPIVALFLITLFVIVIESNSNKKALSRILQAAVLLTVCFEIGLGHSYLFKFLSDDEVDQFETYQIEETKLLEDVRNIDNGLYRIVQNQTRSMDYTTVSLNQNESMNFDFMSLTSFSSCPDNRQLQFMEHMGYHTYEGFINMKPMFLIPVDSILGTKYVLSPFSQQGMVKVLESGLTGKDVYQNPYALPMMFGVDNSDISVVFSDDNVFDNWNSVYKAIGNSDEDIMIPVQYQMDESGENIRFDISIPEGDFIMYGRIVTKSPVSTNIKMSDDFVIQYGSDLDADVFYIPTEDDSDSVSIELKAFDTSFIEKVQFYALDLSVIKSYTEKFSTNEAKILSSADGRFSAEINSNSGSVLFTSIPFDKGWEVKVNGNKVTPQMFGDCFMMIPLEEGTNKIDMAYNPPYLLPAVIISLCGISLTVLNLLKKKPSC